MCVCDRDAVRSDRDVIRGVTEIGCVCVYVCMGVNVYVGCVCMWVCVYDYSEWVFKGINGIKKQTGWCVCECVCVVREGGD